MSNASSPERPAPDRVPTRPALACLGEAVAGGAAGAVLGAAVGWPVGAPVIGAAVAGLNGAVGGWLAVYDWRRGRGVAAFVLDSTWALLTTGAGLVIHGLNLLTRDGGYVAELSTRQDRYVYRRGFRLRAGFAMTWGNVVNGAGDVDGDGPQAVRRRRLVTDHEGVHVWQARAFGPVYPVAYLAWVVAGGAAGAVRWAIRRDHSLAECVDAWGYYANPFEWWAYSRDANWPPRVLGDRARLVWKRPLARALAARREPR